jgi:hypothetical protein
MTIITVNPVHSEQLPILAMALERLVNRHPECWLAEFTTSAQIHVPISDRNAALKEVWEAISKVQLAFLLEPIDPRLAGLVMGRDQLH